MYALGKRMFCKWFGPARHTTQPMEGEKVQLMPFEKVFNCHKTAPYLQVSPRWCHAGLLCI